MATLHNVIIQDRVHHVLVETNALDYVKELRTALGRIAPSHKLQFDVVTDEDAYNADAYLTGSLKAHYDLFVVSKDAKILCTPLFHLCAKVFVLGDDNASSSLVFVHSKRLVDGVLIENDLRSLVFAREYSPTVRDLVSVRDKPQRFLERVCQLLGKVVPKPVIVEIGSSVQPLQHPLDMIVPECCNTPHSTYFFCRVPEAEVHTVDLNPAAATVLEQAVRSGRMVLRGSLEIHTKDAIKYLNESRSADLLYMDAWDPATGEACAQQYLGCIKAALPRANKDNFVLVDGTDLNAGTAISLAYPFLLRNGYYVVFKGRQTLFYNGHPQTLWTTDLFPSPM